MTLINYLSRIHFADGILEDALHSEMERNQYSRPLIICENRIVETEYFDRLKSGFPYRNQIACFEVTSDHLDRSNNDDLKSKCITHEADVIVAFGSTYAIADASLVCAQNRQTSLRHKAAKGIADKDKDKGLGLFAIPGIDGLPNFNWHPQLPTQRVSQFTGNHAQPDVIICDPTITMGESPQRTASSAVLTMVRCIEAFVPDAFNPPADAIAPVSYTHLTLPTIYSV